MKNETPPSVPAGSNETEWHNGRMDADSHYAIGQPPLFKDERWKGMHPDYQKGYGTAWDKKPTDDRGSYGTQSRIEVTPDEYRRFVYDRAMRDASLGVGHVWTEVKCPAYRSLNGLDCTC